MNYTVFYSWQSDLENKFNRSFILDALEKAVKNISQDEAFAIDAVVDRDTFGMPGSPSIVESITGKIAKSDVFVCDVSIINIASDERPTPNPNVMFELGYASAVLGWERIILVQNAAYGGPEKLPFDLRGRRILQYTVDESVESKTEEKQQLKQQLVNTFRGALSYYSNAATREKDKIIWWGTWNMETKTKVRGGTLHINRVASDAFFFSMSLFDGARTGDIFAKAQILTPHSAYARIKTFDNKECGVHFRRRIEGDSWFIDVEEGENCSSFHGAGTSFTGTYKHTSELVVNRGYLDEIDLNEIERLTGKHLSTFLVNFQRISIDKESYPDLVVVSAGVKGLYTIMESIVVLDCTGNIWCACLDPEVEVVRYFTNLSTETQPKPEPMQEWLSKFKHRPLFINNIEEKVP